MCPLYTFNFAIDKFIGLLLVFSDSLPFPRTFPVVASPCCPALRRPIPRTAAVPYGCSGADGFFAPGWRNSTLPVLGLHQADLRIVQADFT